MTVDIHLSGNTVSDDYGQVWTFRCRGNVTAITMPWKTFRGESIMNQISKATKKSLSAMLIWTLSELKIFDGAQRGRDFRIRLVVELHRRRTSEIDAGKAAAHLPTTTSHINCSSILKSLTYSRNGVVFFIVLCRKFVERYDFKTRFERGKI